jgi:hypothetical protein
MFRFIMMVLLMAACFFAGKMSAQEGQDQFIVEYVEQAEVSPQEILALARNQDLKTQFPDLHGKLMIFLARPQIQAQLVNPNRSSSPLYQKLVELVVLINSKLNQEII